MWEKAACLVADEKSITAAPGLPNAKMVASYSCPQKPHVVTVLASEKIMCDCLNYKSRSICAHALAVAEKSGELVQLLQWYKRTNQGANLWSLARSFDAPKRPGAKPGTNTRKRSRVSQPPAETCSKLSTTRANDAQLQSSHSQVLGSIQCNEQFHPLPTGAPWGLVSSSGSTESHYIGPSYLSYSIGSSESHYAGPRWSYPFSLPQCSAPQYVSPQYLPFQPYEPCYQSAWHCAPMRSPVNSFNQGNFGSTQTVYEPPQDTKNPFILKFISNRIHKCQGCKESLCMPDNSLPTAPDDLIACRMERRPFVATDGAVKIPAKSSASHYHLKMECLTAAAANFDPKGIVLPSDVKKNLTSQHYAMLSKFGLN